MLAVPEIDMIAAAFTFGVAASMKAVVEVDNSAVPDQLRSKFGTLSSQTCVPYLREIPVKLVRADYVGLVTESARRSSLMNPSLVRKIIKTDSFLTSARLIRTAHWFDIPGDLHGAGSPRYCS